MSFKPIKASIQNFQSIKSIEFDISGFTCITGKTNIGKSALIRSLRSALLNSPVTNMVRRGEKCCVVDLHSEGWGFQWKKGGGTNRYYIDGKKDPLDSVGQGQVEEIADFGFGSIKVGDKKKIYPWMAAQFDPIFLLNQSGPAITDFISDVSRLDVLQKGISIANKGKRRNKDKSKLIEEDLKQAKEKIGKFDRFGELQVVYADLKDQKASIEEYERRIAKGARIRQGINKSERDVALFAAIEKVKIPKAIGAEEIEKLIDAEKLNKRLKRSAQAVIQLKAIGGVKIPDSIELPEVVMIEKIYNIKKEKDKLESSVAKLSNHIEIPELPEFPESLNKGWRILMQVKSLESEISDFERKKENSKEQLEQINAQIAKIPKCSTCEQPWDSSHTHG